MGGAFSGLADDVNAVYWNPAGLAQTSRPSFTLMFPDKPRDINYDLYIAGAIPANIDLLNSPAWKSKTTIAFAYIYNNDPDYLYYTIESSTERQEIRAKDVINDYVQLSAGKYIYRDNVSIGLSLKQMNKGITLKKYIYDKTAQSWSYISEKRYVDQVIEMDVGIMAYLGEELGTPEKPVKQFSAGLLMQNINHSKLFDTTIQPNYRPGVAYRPDKNSVLSLEIYDAAANYAKTPQVRFGGEVWIYEQADTKEKILALRGGVYDSNDRDMKAYTCGLGIRLPWLSNASQYLDTKNVFELDYALMRWVQDEKNTSLFSLGLQINI